jgi:hypothetical protein
MHFRLNGSAVNLCIYLVDAFLCLLFNLTKQECGYIVIQRAMDIVIDKVVVNCEVDYHNRPTDLGKETERFIKQRVLPLIEEILIELNPEFSHITLAKASLDLNLESDGGSMDGMAVGYLRSVLKKQILTNVMEKAERASADEGAWQQFIFIVKKGYKPWGFKHKSHVAFEQSLLSNLESLKSNPPFVWEIKEVLADFNFIYRIANVYSVEFIIKLLKAIYREIIYSEDQILSDIHKISSVLGCSDEFSLKYILLVLTVYSFANIRQDETGDIPLETKKIFRSVVRIKRSGLQKIPPLAIKELLVTLQKLLSKNATGRKAGKNLSDGKSRQEKDYNQKNYHPKDEQVRLWQQDGVFVQNAGLVLLANFLPHFFEQLGLYKDNVLTDPHKCVYLLQMVCGVDNEEEYDLALNKILCGLEPEENLKRRKQFRKKDITEGKRLLDSVITHWAALKNTSAETLKNVFLRREGKLYWEGESVLLQVDKKTEDVLLDFLPWSFGMIKLPWMKYMITVKWND